MCGRFTLKRPERVNFHRIERSVFDGLVPRFNIAPSQNILAVVEHGSRREAKFLQWGLIPYWSKEPKAVINARVETIEEKASFKDSFQRRRCLIAADGFYEWERVGKISQPYYFQMKDGSPFAFAGVWDRWEDKSRSVTSCAIITTTANELLAEIHNRMPVILPSESFDLWLSDASRAADLKDLLVPFPADLMTSHPVGYEVNNTKTDDESLLRRVEPNIGTTMRLF
jgi:putative SOS response-associated peptidase YedK